MEGGNHQDDNSTAFIGTSEVPLLNNIIEPPMKFWEIKAADIIYAVSIVIIVIGTIGNILSFMVFNKKSMSQSVTSYYFRVLAVTDTMVLYTGTLIWFLIGAFHYNVYNLYTSTCKIFSAAIPVSCYTSCWILVLVAIDRFIGVFVPHKYRQLCTRRRATVSMLVTMFLVIGTTGFFNVFAMDLDSNHECVVKEKYLWFFTNIYQWADLFVLNLIPALILIVTNVSIISSLISAAVVRSESAREASNKKVFTSTTTILLSVSLAYFLCTIPSSSYFIIETLVSSTPKHKAQLLFYKRTGLILFSANHGINFFLYCLHGTSFRRELRSLFCKKDKSSMYSSTQDTYSTQMSTTKVVTSD